MLKLKVIDGTKGEGVEVTSQHWITRTRKRAKTLAKVLDDGYMEMAEILYRVWDPNDGTGLALYSRWGYQTFEDYVEEELNINLYKAEELRRMWYRFEVELKGLSNDLMQRLRALGWSKAKELVRVMTIQSAGEWLDIAESATWQELLVTIKVYKDRIHSEILRAEAEGESIEDEAVASRIENASMPAVKEKLHTETFFLFPEQKDLVKEAISRAQELSSSSKKSHNLALICMDFLATNSFTDQSAEHNARFLSKIASNMGLRITVFDPDSNDSLIHGADFLREWAARQKK